MLATGHVETLLSEATRELQYTWPFLKKKKKNGLYRTLLLLDVSYVSQSGRH